MRPVAASIALGLCLLAPVARGQTNSPPFIHTLLDQEIQQGGQTAPMPFIIGDAETPADKLRLRLESSDQAVLPAVEVCGTENAGFCFGGSGTNRTLVLNPGCNHGGTLVSVIVTDELGASATNSFWLTVMMMEHPVFIDAVADQVTWEGVPTDSIPLRILLHPCYEADFKIWGNSSDQMLVPNANITFRGSTTNWTATITPAAHRFGRATIGITVSDGFGTIASWFNVAVNASLGSDWIGGNPVLTWTATNGVLQQASSITGPWEDLVPAPVSPYTLRGTVTRFYRLRAE